MEELCLFNNEKKTRDLFDLSKKVAIVTGSSKGIGLSIASAFAEYGANVVLSSRSQEAVDKPAKVLNQKGFSVIAQACHVGDEIQRKNLVNKTLEKFGRIDILVSNAAINPIYEPLEKMMKVNVKSVFALSNLCFPRLRKGKDRAIINISSIEGLKPSLGLGIYSVTKAGLIQTKFSQALWSNQVLLNQIEKKLPPGRMAQSNEMTGLALYPASKATSYSSGGVFTADGGYMVM